ncbi:MAG: RluA family pseudouridine synthase [bacterium]
MGKVWNGKEERLDLILKSFLPDISREMIKTSIIAGKVMVNGKIVLKPSARIKGGSVIDFQISERETIIEPYSSHIDIVYEDEDIIVVNKPPGLVVHPAPSVREPTLVNILIGHTSLANVSRQRPGIVHRLDRDTSGLMVVAKSIDGYNRLVEEIRERRVKKEYIAVVHNKARSGSINLPIGRSPYDKSKMQVIHTGRNAITHIKVLEIIGDYSVLNVSIETGRTHQIRVHLAYIGNPIVGDMMYGVEGDRSLISRQALHSSRLSFIHPRTRRELNFEVDLPQDMKTLIERLKRF